MNDSPEPTDVKRTSRRPLLLAAALLAAGGVWYVVYGPPGRRTGPDLFGPSAAAAAAKASDRPVTFALDYRGAPAARASLALVTPDGRRALVVGLGGYVVVDMTDGAEIGRGPCAPSPSDVAAATSDGRYVAFVDAAPPFRAHVFDCERRAPVEGYAASALDPEDAAAFAAGGRVPVRLRAPSGPELRLWLDDAPEGPALDALSAKAPPADAAPRVVRRAAATETAYGPCVVAVYDAVSGRRSLRVATSRATTCDPRLDATAVGRRYAVDVARRELARIVGARVVVSTFDAPDDVAYEIAVRATAVAASAGRWLVGDADGGLRVFDGAREESAERLADDPLRAFGTTDALRFAATFEPGTPPRLLGDPAAAFARRSALVRTGGRTIVDSGVHARRPSPVGGPILARRGRIVVPRRTSSLVYSAEIPGAVDAHEVDGLPCGFDGRYAAFREADGTAAIYDLASPRPQLLRRIGTPPLAAAVRSVAWSGRAVLATFGAGAPAARIRKQSDRYASLPTSFEDEDQDRRLGSLMAAADAAKRTPRATPDESAAADDASVAARPTLRLVSADGLYVAELRPDGRLVRTTHGGTVVGEDALKDVDLDATDVVRSPDGSRFVVVERRRDAGGRRTREALSVRCGSFAGGLVRDVVFRPPPPAAAPAESSDGARSAFDFLSDGRLVLAMGDRVDVVSVATGTIVGTIPGPADVVAVRPETDELAVAAGSEVRIYRRTGVQTP